MEVLITLPDYFYYFHWKGLFLLLSDIFLNIKSYDFSYPQILESFIFAGLLNFVLVRYRDTPP